MEFLQTSVLKHALALPYPTQGLVVMEPSLGLLAVNPGIGEFTPRIRFPFFWALLP